MLRLTQVRERRGWSKSELGRRSGVALSTISNLEGGKVFPFAGWKKKLAAALGVDESTLFDEV